MFKGHECFRKVLLWPLLSHKKKNGLLTCLQTSSCISARCLLLIHISYWCLRKEFSYSVCSHVQFIFRIQGDTLGLVVTLEMTHLRETRAQRGRFCSMSVVIDINRVLRKGFLPHRWCDSRHGDFVSRIWFSLKYFAYLWPIQLFFTSKARPLTFSGMSLCCVVFSFALCHS